jgi:predicted ATPase
VDKSLLSKKGDDMHDQEEALKISKSVIQHFSLRLANGYKDIELSANNSVKILVAENGAGKTTLLNTLYSILIGDYRLFLTAEFDELSLTISGRSWKHKRSEFAPITDEIHNELSELDIWRRMELSPPSKIEAEELVLATIDGDENAIDNTRYYAKENVQHRFPGSYLKSSLQSLGSRSSAATVKKRRDSFLKFIAEVQETLEGHSVLYLPTYRRIEALLPEYRIKQGATRRSQLYRRSGQPTQLIHFGLQDVESRLSEMAEEIRRTTVRAFSQINARTLDDLVFGNYKRNIEDSNPINLESLQVVLGRLGRNDEKTRRRMESLISSGEINKEDNIYLKSFLDQLMQTYASTQDRESAIEAFIEVINSYWLDDINEKCFLFDKASAEAKVENVYTGKKLPLEALSSGEKQIISIFARLYLEPEQNVIVLIDEPELSLSIEWQMKFLPDIVRAKSCRQLIAITHSPFIFKNDLRPYAGDLKVLRYKKHELNF